MAEQHATEFDMSNDSKTTDPRIEAGAKAWDKHMGGRYAPHEVEELSEEVEVILAAADAVDPQKPRTITTVEELDALPVGSVIRDGDEELMEKTDIGWCCWVYIEGFLSSELALPATVLHEPEAEVGA